MSKIVGKIEFRDVIRPMLKEQNKTIALCHGVFDLVHLGHMIHFEQAKAMADILVVSVTAEKYVIKGPGRPYFNDEQRLKFLQGLECIDYVMLSEQYTADNIIECVEPDIYVKGQEYADENADVTENIRPEREKVEAHGGKIAYTTGQVFSSTKLINTAMSGLSSEVVDYMTSFKKKYVMDDIKNIMVKAKEKKILVIGDVIVDQYTYCNVNGLMSKDLGYSTRIKSSEQYIGGAGAVARHLASFSNDITLLSIMGDEEDIHRNLIGNMTEKVKNNIVKSNICQTVIKQRYLVKNEKREEYKKVFEVNNIGVNNKFDTKALREFKRKLDAEVDKADIVFLCDFGHGLIDQECIDTIEKKSKYLVLNCQTNSSNYGMNIITKYRRADVFSLDQKELSLAFPMEHEERDALNRLSRHLGCDGWLTRGSMGAWCIEDEEITKCPAFTLYIKDTVGAGDSFYAVAGLAASMGAKMELAMFLGNIAGALATNIIGNRESIKKVDVLKFAATLLNV